MIMMGNAAFELESSDAPPERRAVPRQWTASADAWIVRREDVSRFLRSSARLIDISDKGARVSAERMAFKENVLWIGLVGLPSEWVKATIRAIRPDGPVWTYHLEFCEPCPCGLLEGAMTEPESDLVLSWDLP
jgi:hypothetical protein